MESFFVKVKIFRFWPKTMDYNKAFWPKSRSFFVVLLHQNGRCYEALICIILLLLRCAFIWCPFWPKSTFSDSGRKPWTIYNQAFWPKSSSFFVVLLLLAGRCYEAEICTIMLPLRTALAWYHFWPKSKFSRFWRKTMDYIVRRFDQLSFCTHNSSLEGASFCFSCDALSDGSIQS